MGRDVREILKRVRKFIVLWNFRFYKVYWEATPLC